MFRHGLRVSEACGFALADHDGVTPSCSASIIVENTKAGLKSARKNGCIGGRPLLMTDEKLRAAKAMLNKEIQKIRPEK
jgi:hypothetical protein